MKRINRWRARAHEEEIGKDYIKPSALFMLSWCAHLAVPHKFRVRTFARFTAIFRKGPDQLGACSSPLTPQKGASSVLYFTAQRLPAEYPISALRLREWFSYKDLGKETGWQENLSIQFVIFKYIFLCLFRYCLYFKIKILFNDRYYN